MINPLTGNKKKKGREAKEISHRSYFASLFLGDFALIGGRNERSNFDKAKLNELLSKLWRYRR